MGKEADTRTRLGTQRKSSAVRVACCVLSQAAARDERNTQRRKPEKYRLCVGRSMARFPLDAAADAGLLVGIDQLAGKHGIDGCTQISAGDRFVVARTAVVELAPVDQAPVPIKQIKVRCAGGLVCLCNLLRSEEHTSELQSLRHLVCRLLLE